MHKPPMLSFLFLLACGCGGAPPATSSTEDHEVTEPETESSGGSDARAPQSLDEGLAALGLTRIELEGRRLGRTVSFDAAPSEVEDGVLTVTEAHGVRPSVAIFAQREDGTIVMVDPEPEVIVDRHVDGGCQRFAGGRMEMIEVAYTLPEGAAYGGVVTVPYEEHTEVIDYSPTQADGSPCPPMAMD